MVDDTKSAENKEKFSEAYHRMLERMKEAAERAKQDAAPRLHYALETAKEKASELGELTREEAEEIGTYLMRDLEAAAEYLRDGGQALADWLRLDMLLVEQRFKEAFADMVDHTRLELDHLAKRAAKFGEWHTGEMTAPGALQCMSCGEEIHFHAAGHIPPCPKCHGTRFKRVFGN